MATLRDFVNFSSATKLSEQLFVTRGNLNSVIECTKIIDPLNTSLEQLLTDLQMKYRDNLEGVSLKSYLYSTASKLAVIKNFREEAFNLHTDFTSQEVKAAPLGYFKDFIDPDQFKFLYKLSNLPQNPTSINQQMSH